MSSFTKVIDMFEKINACNSGDVETMLFFVFLKKKKKRCLNKKKKSASVLIKVSAKVPADRKPLSLGQAIV